MTTKRTICFDCGAGPWKARMRRYGAGFARLVRKVPAGRHCENCDRALPEPVEAWKRERDFERESKANGSSAGKAESVRKSTPLHRN